MSYDEEVDEAARAIRYRAGRGWRYIAPRSAVHLARAVRLPSGVYWCDVWDRLAANGWIGGEW